MRRFLILCGYFAIKTGLKVVKKYILNESQADLKLQRMALQILERNTQARKIILAGIAPNGTIMALKLKEWLGSKGDFTVEMQEITLNKRLPEEIVVAPYLNLEGAVVILVDDVANSGRTLTYALKPFLEQHPFSIQTLVLVDRTHKKFPIQPDYVGFSLASTLEEYIDLDVEDGEIKGAWMQ